MPAVSEKHTMTEHQTETSNDDSVEEEPHETVEETTVPERRSSTRLQNCPKKPRFEETHSSSEDDPFANDDDSDYSESSLSNSSGKRIRRSVLSESVAKVFKRNSTKNKQESTKSTKKRTRSKSTSYVVLKADIQKGVYPDIWKVDGKSLLQKYVPFVEGNETFYRNTSVYSGWTLHSRDQYVDADVKFVRKNGRDTVVRFNIQQISDDSD